MPVLAVSVVAFVVLDVGRTRPVVGARLRGGPTEGAGVLSYRLEVVQRHDDWERAIPSRPVSVEAHLANGDALDWHGVLDAEGAASVTFPRRTPPVAGPVRVSIAVSGVPGLVLDARVALTRAEWAGRARRRGGWVEGGEANGLVVRAAAGRGAFAVPFADPLLIDVRRRGAPFGGSITAESLPESGGKPRIVYPAPGTALPVRWPVRPIEHATSVPIVAKDSDGTTATLDVTLAVIPGALHAELEGDELHVESPIMRDRAYVAVVSETARLGGGTVALHPTDRGTAEGVLVLPLPAESPLWAVVSSEPDMRSASLIGWPIRDAVGGDAPTTFDVADVLVADSVNEKVTVERARVRRIRLFSALFAASAILLSAVLVARRARAAQVALETHLARSGAGDETTTKVATSAGGGTGVVLVAVLCLVLAAALVGVFATLN